MGNVLSKEKREQVVALGRLGWPLRRIEEATGVRRETTSGYLKAAGVAVRPPRRWGHGLPVEPTKGVSTDSGGEQEAKPAKEVSTDSEPSPLLAEARPGRAPSASACEPYGELIEEKLGRGRNAMAIYQDLVDEHGFEAKYASVMRFVRKLRGTRGPKLSGVIITGPGEEAQVDYGDGPMVRSPKTGKYRRVRLFVLTLGYSRKAVRLLVERSSTQIWAELHERAFRRLGGSVRRVVLDNLKEGVLKPDIYDPDLNPLYRDVLAHYDIVALPCRVRDPDRKGKVESSVGHTQRTPLKGMRFESLEEAQDYLDRWDRNWADTRIHGTTKRQVAVMFAEERPHLQSLPVEPFRYYEFGVRTVHLDGNVEVGGSFYEALPGRIGQQLSTQWDAHCVRILDPKTGELFREHRRIGRGRYTPRTKGPKTPPTTLEVLARAQRAGKNIDRLAQEIHHKEGENGVRRILGLLSLARKYGPVQVDQTCSVALEIGVTSYRFVRRYLERQPSLPLAVRQVDPLIRELTHYRDVIERIAAQPQEDSQ